MDAYCLLCLLPLMVAPEPPPPVHSELDLHAAIMHVVRETDGHLSDEERREWLKVEGDGLDLTNWIGVMR